MNATSHSKEEGNYPFPLAVRPPRRNQETFQQLKGRIIGLREGGFSYRAIGARVQRNSSAVMRIWKQWTDEHRTTRKTGSGRRKDHDSRIRVRYYAGERCLPECVIERHSDLTPRVMHAWDLAGRRLTREPRPATSKDELLLRIQAIWNSLPQADIQNLFDSMPRRIAALIATHVGCTKY
ncbi:transposable element Tcb2 transposase [Trichonephila clavipes]|nr:transposable element Tcb2 transposase [Trichonephila clavipes]